MRDIMRDIMYSGSQSPQNVATIIHWAYEVLEVTTRREICENDDFQAKSTKNDPKWPKVVTFGDIKITFMRDIMRDIMYSGSQSLQDVANIIHWAYEALEVATMREICENDDFRAKTTKNDPISFLRSRYFWRYKNNVYA